PKLFSDSGQDCGTASAGTKGNRFNNGPSLRVHRHRKTQYSYIIGLRLPKEKLERFPRYNGKVKDFLRQWSGSFVTLKFHHAQLRVFATWHRDIPSSAVSPPSLLSASASAFSEADTRPRTPCTAYPSPDANRTN